MARGLAQWPGEGGRQLCPLGRFELQVTGNPTQSGSNDKNFYYFMKKKKKEPQVLRAVPRGHQGPSPFHLFAFHPQWVGPDCSWLPHCGKIAVVVPAITAETMKSSSPAVSFLRVKTLFPETPSRYPLKSSLPDQGHRLSYRSLIS